MTGYLCVRGVQDYLFQGQKSKKTETFFDQAELTGAAGFHAVCVRCALLPHLPLDKNILKFYPKRCFTSQKYIDYIMLLKIIGDSLWINKFKHLIDWSN